MMLCVAKVKSTDGRLSQLVFKGLANSRCLGQKDFY